MTRGGGEAGNASAEGFDPLTGFVLAPRLAMRIRDALAGSTGALLVACCRIDNFTQLSAANPAHAQRLLLHVGDLLRAKLPFQHTLARTGVAELCFVLPNAGDEPDSHARSIASEIAREVSRDVSANRPTAVELVFGYAQAPRDGADAEVLLRAARRPRLRLQRR